LALGPPGIIESPDFMAFSFFETLAIRSRYQLPPIAIPRPALP